MRRRGFTLVELLVVIAIIGVLVALLLPAVQAAREAARRMSCSNNIKNLALACHSYHDTYRKLPAGYLRKFPAVNNTPYWAWGAAIMPYMEQNALFDQLQVGDLPIELAAANPQLRQLMRQPVAIFRCPSDVGPPVQTVAGLRIAGQNTAVSNYVGANGSRFANTTSQTAIHGGCFVRDANFAFRDILDGQSNTVLLGERRWRYKSRATGAQRTTGAANVFGVRNNNSVCSGRANVMAAGRSAMNYDQTNTICRARYGFSSQHPAGAMFALADGSVRFIAETIESDISQYATGTDTQYSTAVAAQNIPNTTWEKMLARSDGASVTIP